MEDETIRLHLKAAEHSLSRPQHTIHRPDPEYVVKKTVEEARDGLKAGDMFSYADEFNLS